MLLFGENKIPFQQRLLFNTCILKGLKPVYIFTNEMKKELNDENHENVLKYINEKLKIENKNKFNQYDWAKADELKQKPLTLAKH